MEDASFTPCFSLYETEFSFHRIMSSIYVVFTQFLLQTT